MVATKALQSSPPTRDGTGAFLISLIGSAASAMKSSTRRADVARQKLHQPKAGHAVARVVVADSRTIQHRYASHRS
jgi:hypothetical protein